MMKTPTALVVTALTLLAAPGFANTGSTNLHGGKSALRALEDPSLQTQRAGAVPARASIGSAERAGLRAAEARNAGLEKLRAGDLHLSDHDLTIIGIVVAVVLILIIIT